MRRNDKPGRTLGISLAIVLSAMIYSVVPMVIVGYSIAAKVRFRQALVMAGGDNFLGGAMGIGSIPGYELAMWGIPAALYLVVGVMSWRGKPSYMRGVMTGSVVFLMVWYTGLSLYRVWLDAQFMADSGAMGSQSVFAPLRQVGYGISLLVTLYVVWYMNRGPARAFFRGYYLERPEEEGV